MGPSLADPFNVKNFTTYYKKMSNSKKRKKYWTALIKDFPKEFFECLLLFQKNKDFEFMREVHLFDRPESQAEASGSFVYSNLALPGKHSLYIYCPDE